MTVEPLLVELADLLVVSGDLILDQTNGTVLYFADLAATPNAFANSSAVFAMINDSGDWNGGLFTCTGPVLARGMLAQLSQIWWLAPFLLIVAASPTRWREPLLPG